MNDMTDFNDLHRLAGPDAVRECINSAINSETALAYFTVAKSQLDIWPAPKEIKTDLPIAPAFDAKALLPATLADFVLDEADRMPCSPDYIAAALVVCLGSVIGARCGIKPKAGTTGSSPRICLAASWVTRLPRSRPPWAR